MATLDSNPASLTFNCYCSLAEATAYMDTRVHTSNWSNASSTDKVRSLIWATRQLDSLQWKGWLTKPDQPHQFPRMGVFRDGGDYAPYDSAVYNVYQFPSDTIPQFVKDATAELALWLLGSDTTAPTGLEGFKSLKVDTISIEVDARNKPSWFNSAVKDIVWRYLRGANPFMAKVQRV